MIPRFWREIPSRYNLIGTKCPKCSTIFFPPKEICKRCRRSSIDQMEKEKLSGKGTIQSFTRVHEAANGFDEITPYYLALIELDEGPTVMAQIVDCMEEELAIGVRVKMAFRKVSQEGSSGTIHYGYKFLIDK